MNGNPPKSILDCAGKAQRRRRFCIVGDWSSQSGIALRLPPQSKTPQNL